MQTKQQEIQEFSEVCSACPPLENTFLSCVQHTDDLSSIPKEDPLYSYRLLRTEPEKSHLGPSLISVAQRQLRERFLLTFRSQMGTWKDKVTFMASSACRRFPRQIQGSSFDLPLGIFRSSLLDTRLAVGREQCLLPARSPPSTPHSSTAVGSFIPDILQPRRELPVKSVASCYTELDSKVSNGKNSLESPKSAAIPQGD